MKDKGLRCSRSALTVFKSLPIIISCSLLAVASAAEDSKGSLPSSEVIDQITSESNNAPAVPRVLVPPTTMQIAQARKLMLGEGTDGDSSPTSLQSPDVAPGSTEAEITDDSGKFKFRLKDTSFLDSFAGLRQLINGEQNHTTTASTTINNEDKNKLNETVASVHNNKTTGNNYSNNSPDMSSDSLSKKTGRVHEDFVLEEDGEFIIEVDGPESVESQRREVRLPLTDYDCVPGSGRCLDLRERLMLDLTNSYNRPLPSRIRYRLKRKPSIFTTRKPFTRKDIGIPDIYESEVDIESKEFKSLNFSKPQFPRNDHSFAADSDSLIVLPTQKSVFPSGASDKSDPGDINKSDESKENSNNYRRSSHVSKKRPGRIRSQYRPRRILTRTHLDYRRPVNFQFKRTRKGGKNVLKTHNSKIGGSKEKQVSKTASDKYLPPTLHDGMSPYSVMVKVPHIAQYGQQMNVGTKYGKPLPGILPHRQRKVSKTQSDYKVHSVSHKSDSVSYGVSKKEVEKYETFASTTVSPVFYEQPLEDYIPPKVDHSRLKESSEEDYKQAHSPRRYPDRQPSASSVPHHSPRNQPGTKSASVPRWLMGLKNEPLVVTPPPGYHPTTSKRRKQISNSSPRPSDYALNPFKPTSLPRSYTAPATPKPKYGVPKNAHEIYSQPDKHLSVIDPVPPPHVPNHFQLIKPSVSDSLAHPPLPPPHLHVPLEQQYLPPTKSKSPIHSSPKEVAKPYYPVTSAPDGQGGSRYQVKVVTPAKYYGPPVQSSHELNSYGYTPLPIYAPPTSPRPKYGPTVAPNYSASVSGKPPVAPYAAHLKAVTPPSIHQHRSHKVDPKDDKEYGTKIAGHKPKATKIPAVHATTYKPPEPKNDIVKLKEFSYPSHSPVSKKPVITSTSYTPPVYTPHQVATTLAPKGAQPSQTLRQNPLHTYLASNPALLPLLLDDYYYDDEYYYDDLYSLDDDDLYYYYDDYYDLDYYYDFREAAESRPVLPQLVPSLGYESLKSQIHDHGYIAGIPGRAGRDYPILSYIPHTSFVCDYVADYPGYYADMEAGCQVFHVCHHDGRQDSFLCPNGTVFNQKYFVCDWWYNFNCEDAPFFYPINAAIGFPSIPLHASQFERERHLYGPNTFKGPMHHKAPGSTNHALVKPSSHSKRRAPSSRKQAPGSLGYRPRRRVPGVRSQLLRGNRQRQADRNVLNHPQASEARPIFKEPLVVLNKEVQSSTEKYLPSPLPLSKVPHTRGPT